ncbi:MAG: DUF3298 and DUF4163 domain-containing protein [Anaerovibrio sp.]|uniref:DUF3298 and DUF4163 domain-containing protein n=1 Tax=Anaerovibrio sp. TaxID=1872532 RepID=UPI0025C23FC7|nr:DUF3298 and DUF4163 domain-containing protein [Anaerovibrio sp.]MBE6100078.1 DUF3298 and DUF4163 domain-containing protein [Anaerovibrio sp.]
MGKKMLAVGAAVLAMGLVAPLTGDSYLGTTTYACEEGGYLRMREGTPGGIPYSEGLGYMSAPVKSQMFAAMDGKLMLNATTYQVNLAPESAAMYPKLQAALEKLSKENLNSMNDMMIEWNTDLQEEYKIGKENGIYQNEAPFAYELRYSGLRADSTVFSCYGTEYVYLGGAHPVTYYKTATIDTKSGKRLSLSDVLKTTDGFAELLATETIKQLDDREAIFDKKELVKNIQYMMDHNDLQFGLTEDGMQVFFGNYEIGPYAMGTAVVNLPQSKYFSIFRPKYIFYGYRAKG